MNIESALLKLSKSKFRSSFHLKKKDIEYIKTVNKELGEDMSPRLSKSCINHRLRKISEIADNHRKEEK